MNSKQYKIIAGTLVALLAITLFSFYSYHQYSSKLIEEKKGEIKSKNLKIENLSSRITSLKSKIENLSLEKENLKEEKSLLEDQIDQLKRNISSLSNKIKDFKEIISSLEEELKKYEFRKTNYSLLAINSDGEGEVFHFETRVISGDGDVSVIVNDVEFKHDTQSSVRRAWYVAGEKTEKNISLYDASIEIEYKKESILSVKGGSGGAPFTLALYAALKNKTIDQNIYLTGTIESDGSIGKVGEVEKKARIAREKGGQKILVPEGEYVSVSGINVEEVSDIEEVINIALN